MKKIIFLALAISTLLGCSSDSNNSDSNSSSNNLFLNINIAGTNFNSEYLNLDFGGEENCLNNGTLVLQKVGTVENSSVFVDCYLVFFENLIDFSDPQKNIVTNTRMTDINDLWEANFSQDVCSKNNDFSIIYEDKISGDLLRFKPNAPKNHTITNVQFNSEDATSKFYIVEGNFNATFLKGSSDVPMSGNYRIKIEVFI
jgi:hypothetical protein